MRHAEMPIFTGRSICSPWLLPLTNHFPRAHRHTVTRRLTDAALDLRERLEEANLQPAGRLTLLIQADAALSKLRLYLRLAARLGWLKRRPIRARVAHR